MLSALYRASFFLYEISFLLFAIALWYNSLSLRKINQALGHPPYWIFPAVGGVLLFMCAFNHYWAYHHLSPQYLQNEAHYLLIRMYVFKTLSMLYILVAGAGLGIGNYLYYQKMIK